MSDAHFPAAFEALVVEEAKRMARQEQQALVVGPFFGVEVGARVCEKHPDVAAWVRGNTPPKTDPRWWIAVHGAQKGYWPSPGLHSFIESLRRLPDRPDP